MNAHRPDYYTESVQCNSWDRIRIHKLKFLVFTGGFLFLIK